MSAHRRSGEPEVWRSVSFTTRQAIRARMRREIDQGGVYCPFCRGLIPPGAPFEVDHHVPVRDAPELLTDVTNLRPAHPACNRRAGAVWRNKAAARQRRQATAPCGGCGVALWPGWPDWLCESCRDVVDGGL